MTDAPHREHHLTRMHGTAVAIGEVAVLLTGPSGAGKSSTALQLMAYGAQLIADDQVELFLGRGTVMVRKPATLPDLIEARGVGLLAAPLADPARLGLVVDMARLAKSRCPEPRNIQILGIDIPKLDKVEGSHFPAAILLYLKYLNPSE